MRRSRRGSSPGSARTAATTCRGRTRAIRTASGCPKSCCSRRRSRRSFRTTSVSWPRFPTCARWPPRRIERVLEHWSGLGYYRRAHHLHAAAQVGGRKIRRRVSGRRAHARHVAGHRPLDRGGHRGVRLRRARGHPRRQREARAGAPSRHRRLSRRRRMSRHTLWRAAEALLPARDIETYTQALMDLGATVCTRAAARLRGMSGGRGLRRVRASDRIAELPSPRPQEGAAAARGARAADRARRRNPVREAAAAGHLGRLVEPARTAAGRRRARRGAGRASPPMSSCATSCRRSRMASRISR